MEYKVIIKAFALLWICTNGVAMEEDEDKSNRPTPLKRKLPESSQDSQRVAEEHTRFSKHPRADTAGRINLNFSNLSDELVLTLFSYLDYQGLLNIGMTSKKNREIAETTILWQNLGSRENLVAGAFLADKYDRYTYQFLKHPNLSSCKYLTLAHFRPYLPFIRFQMDYAFLEFDEHWLESDLYKVIKGQGKQNVLLNFEGIEVTLTTALGREMLLKSTPKHISNTSMLFRLSRDIQASPNDKRRKDLDLLAATRLSCPQANRGIEFDFQKQQTDEEILQASKEYFERRENEKALRREKKRQLEALAVTLTFAYAELPLKVRYKNIYYSKGPSPLNPPKGIGAIYCFVNEDRIQEDFELRAYFYDLNKSIEGGEVTAELMFGSTRRMPQKLYLIYNPNTYNNYLAPGHATVQVDTFAS